MNQKELIETVAATTGLPKSAVEHVLKEVAAEVQSCVCVGEEVVLPGVGKLGSKVRAARTGRNPATGAEIAIPAKRVPTFIAAKALKDAASV